MDQFVKGEILKKAAAILGQHGHSAVVRDNKVITNAPPVLVGVAWTMACIEYGRRMEDFLIDDAYDLALAEAPEVE